MEPGLLALVIPSFVRAICFGHTCAQSANSADPCSQVAYAFLRKLARRSLPANSRRMLGRSAHSVSAAVPSPWIR